MSNSACSHFWKTGYHQPYISNEKRENIKEDETGEKVISDAIKKQTLEFRVEKEKVADFLRDAGKCIQETDKAEKSLGDVSSGAVGASVGVGATAGSIFLALKLLPKLKFW